MKLISSKVLYERGEHRSHPQLLKAAGASTLVHGNFLAAFEPKLRLKTIRRGKRTPDLI